MVSRSQSQLTKATRRLSSFPNPAFHAQSNAKVRKSKTTRIQNCNIFILGETILKENNREYLHQIGSGKDVLNRKLGQAKMSLTGNNNNKKKLAKEK